MDGQKNLDRRIGRKIWVDEQTKKFGQMDRKICADGQTEKFGQIDGHNDMDR